MLTAALVAVLVILGILWLIRPRRPRDYPPGPPPNYLLGDIQTVKEMIRGNFRSLLKQTHQKYGGFVLPGGTKIVDISDFDLITELCSHPDAQGRPFHILVRTRNFGEKLGVIFSEGHQWLEHRRFALRNLRDLGFGKTSMESLVLEEFGKLANDMDAEEGDPMTVNSRFNLTVLNILWRIVASFRLDSSDPAAQQHVKDMNELIRLVNPSNPLINFAWLRHIIPGRTGYSWMIKYREHMASIMKEVLQEHRQNLDPNDPRDFIDIFAAEMEKPDAEERNFTEKNLFVIGMDFFLAGMETTSTSLSWALLFMVLHPDVQQRVHEEIDRVLGDNSPSYAERRELPFTEAVVLEIMRRATVLPSSVGHFTTADVPMGGYVIPRNTVVLLRLEDIHMDKDYWGDPENFRPDRFIKADGTVNRDKHLIPFGIGKRSCLGEALAKMEMFILFACLMQRYSFRAAPGQNLSMDSDALPTKQPAHFQVIYKLRK